MISLYKTNMVFFAGGVWDKYCGPYMPGNPGWKGKEESIWITAE